MAKLDDASWHLASDDFPPGLPEANAATHIGMFVAWAIHHDCWAEVPGVDWSAEVLRVRHRSITGCRFVMAQCDGKLFAHMFNTAGMAFAEAYYPRTYLRDYHRVLASGAGSEYRVEDSWENYERLAGVIDERYARFKQKPWWKLW